MSDQRKRVRGTDDPINPEFSEGRWQDALRRMRQRIEDGLPLTLEDRTIIGDKMTSASWGMCSRDPDQWPSPDDHVFPADFERRNRIVPRDPPRGARCPMDTGHPDDIAGSVLGHYGCFYRCLLFQHPAPLEPMRIRLHVLNRYDEEIKARVRANGARATEPEPWHEDAEAAE